MDELRYLSVRANGLTFRVAEAGSGDRLALLLHGFPECAYSWRHQLPLLAQRGYRVWAPDLRGYGGTTRPQGVAAYALTELEADVTGLIDASGARSVLLVGGRLGRSDRLELCHVRRASGAAPRRHERAASRTDATRPVHVPSAEEVL